MPPVASPASVPLPQPIDFGLRNRQAEAPPANSPFARLLDENDPPPASEPTPSPAAARKGKPPEGSDGSEPTCEPPEAAESIDPSAVLIAQATGPEATPAPPPSLVIADGTAADATLSAAIDASAAVPPPGPQQPVATPTLPGDAVPTQVGAPAAGAAVSSDAAATGPDLTGTAATASGEGQETQSQQAVTPPAAAKPQGVATAAPTKPQAKPATGANGTPDQATVSQASADESSEQQSSNPEAVPEHAAGHARTSTREAGDRTQAPGLHTEFAPPTARPGAEIPHFAGLHATRELSHLHVANAAQAAAPTADASLPDATGVRVEAVAAEVAVWAQSGRRRFEIRLDPPELGRIDVRLDVDRAGQVTSRLVVERAETLDVLRRDAHQLERALQDAGLRTADNGLQFSLRDQPFAERNDAGTPRPAPDDANAPPAPEGTPAVYAVTLRGGGGVDIRI